MSMKLKDFIDLDWVGVGLDQGIVSYMKSCSKIMRYNVQVMRDHGPYTIEGYMI